MLSSHTTKAVVAEVVGVEPFSSVFDPAAVQSHFLPPPADGSVVQQGAEPEVSVGVVGVSHLGSVRQEDTLLGPRGGELVQWPKQRLVPGERTWNVPLTLQQ